MNKTPDALHVLSLPRAQLVEIELALKDRAKKLEDTVDRAFKRGAVDNARACHVRLNSTRAALSTVMSI